MAITNTPTTDNTPKDMVPVSVREFLGFQVKEFVRGASWDGGSDTVTVHQVFKTPNINSHLVGWVTCYPDMILVSTCECERGFPLTKKVTTVEEGLEALRAVTF